MKINRWAVMALLFSLFAWAALLSPFYFTGAHDGRHSLFYQLQFLQGVSDGYWYPRWGPDFGFGRGYPFFIFYSPLTSYTVQAANSWGMGLVASVKVSWALGFLLGAAGMFRLAKQWWQDDRAAFIAALLYTFIPYKLVDIYVRGAMAEFWSLALFPWAMLLFARLVRHPSASNAIKAGLLYASLILTHIATALLFSPFLGAYILFELALKVYQTPSEKSFSPPSPNVGGGGLGGWGLLPSEKSFSPPSPNVGGGGLGGWGPLPSEKSFSPPSPNVGGGGLGGWGPFRSAIAVACALALGLLNAMIFWVPLLIEQKYIDVSQYVPENYNFATQFTDWSQFISPFWGFDYAIPGPNDGMSFQLGVLPLLLILLSLWLLIKGYINRILSARLIWALVSLFVVVLCMTSFSLPIWQNVPIAPMVQFPWRLLGVSALLLALLGGGTITHLLELLPRQEGLHPAITLIGLLVLYTSYSYIIPNFTPPSDREETLLTILDFQREYPDMAGRLPPTEIVPQRSPMEAQYEAFEPLQKLRLIEGNAIIEQTYYGSSTVRANLSTEQPARIELMTYDYPGWQLYLNDEPHIHKTLSPEGTIVFDLPTGEYQFSAHFEDTSWRWVSKFVSMLTIGLSLLFLLWENRPLAGRKYTQDVTKKDKNINL